jgi:lysophospholipid acyltransferase (LPLAT)-like uncharacterized protein
MKLVKQFFGWMLALVLLAWRLFCRLVVINDPRPSLRLAGRPYIYALLHAHQVAAVFINDDRLMSAMVSRSDDGELLVPSLRVRRVIPVRGSTRSRGQDKGGSEALQGMADLLRRGVPGLLAVDGPLGPRNTVHRGVTDLARETGAAIVPVVVLPSRRFILRGTWDRFQVPKPFCTIRLIFADPIEPAAFADNESLRLEIKRALTMLEATYDADEAERCIEHVKARADRTARKQSGAVRSGADASTKS